MLKQVELRLANLLFRICTQTKHMERLLRKIMKAGVFVLQAEEACLLTLEKRTNRLVLHARHTSGNGAELPLVGREAAGLFDDPSKLWVQDHGNIWIPLCVNGTIQSVLGFLRVKIRPDGGTAKMIDRMAKQLIHLYEYRKNLDDKEFFHAALVEISHVITQSHDFDEMIGKAMDMASEMTGGYCGVTLLSKDGQFLVPVYTYHIKKEDSCEIPLPPGPGSDQTAYTAISERKVTIVEDTSTSPLADREWCKKYGIKSLMTIPLIIHGRPIGALLVYFTYRRIFTELEIDFYKELAHQLSHVIDTLRTRSEILANKLLQDRLIEMMRKMTSRTRLRDVLNDMVFNTYDLLDGRVGVSVWLVNGSQGRIQLSAWKGNGIRFDRKNRVECSLEELGSAAVLEDLFLEVDPKSGIGRFFFDSKADYSIGTPLMAGKDLIGILFLHSPEKREWSEREKLTLSTIGIHAGPIIRHGQYIQLLEKESKLDGLTKVFNRQYFERTFRDYIARHSKQNKPLSVLMIDIDNFKQINDRYGHTVGDAVMRSVARTLLDMTRRADRVFRYGGEEFCILLPWTAKQQAMQVAERIRESVEKSHRDPRVTVSIGVATFLDDTADPRQVIELADLALYEAKSKGKNRVMPAMPM